LDEKAQNLMNWSIQGNAKLRIVATDYHLPERVVTNDELSLEHPNWDMGRVVARTGTASRHIAAPGETALDLAVTACQKLFGANPELHDLVDGILFCTQSGDYVMPPNACVLHRELDLSEEVFAFDTNLACSGYIYSLAIARGLIVAGTCSNILVVTADTYSKYIHPDDRATRTLFGDGAAVSWVSAANDEQAGADVIDILCATSGKGFEAFYIPAGGLRNPRSPESALKKVDAGGNVRTDENIHMDGLGVLSFVNSKVPKQVLHILGRNDLRISDLDLVIFHQASKLALDSLARALQIAPEKIFSNLTTIGNTVSASIPICLAQAQREGRVHPGAKVLLSGFGVGLSWASALLRM
jgi:3-oxoacyl-[acyl-carrier-protein] synthase III